MRGREKKRSANFIGTSVINSSPKESMGTAQQRLFLKQSRNQAALGLHTQYLLFQEAPAVEEGAAPSALGSAGGKGGGWFGPSSRWGTNSSPPHTPGTQRETFVLHHQWWHLPQWHYLGTGQHGTLCSPARTHSFPQSHHSTAYSAAFAFIWTPSSSLLAPELSAEGEQPPEFSWGLQILTPADALSAAKP